MRSRIIHLVSVVFFPASIMLTCMGVGARGTSNQDMPAPADLVRATVAHESAAANNNSRKHMFRDCKKTPQGSQTRIYVETRQAVAGMTVAYNDKPLSAEQLRSEQGRLAGLAENGEQLKRKQREQKEDADRTLRIVKALPDAFLFEYDGMEPGSARIGREGAQLVRLKFHPNPKYQPPSHVEDVLLGMDGVLLVDPVAHRIAEINGTLFEQVSFGWGILGHLNKGGHFLVDQVDVGEGSWEVSRMSLKLTGKILLFKTLTISSDEVFSDFKRVPDGTTFTEGVKILKAEQERLAQGGLETAKSGSTSN